MMAVDQQRTAREDTERTLMQALDTLEGLVAKLPDHPTKPTCIDLVVRLRLETAKVMEADRSAR